MGDNVPDPVRALRHKRCPHAKDHDLPNQPKVLRHPRAPLTLSQSEAAD